MPIRLQDNFCGGQERSAMQRRWSHNRVKSRVLALRPSVLLLVFAVMSDLSGELHGRGQGALLPGAAAQNVSCPGNAGLVRMWPGEDGVGQPLSMCRCIEGYFNTSQEFFRLMLVRELAMQIFDCTPTHYCPRKYIRRMYAVSLRRNVVAPDLYLHVKPRQVDEAI